MNENSTYPHIKNINLPFKGLAPLNLYKTFYYSSQLLNTLCLANLASCILLYKLLKFKAVFLTKMSNLEVTAPPHIKMC